MGFISIFPIIHDNNNAVFARASACITDKSKSTYYGNGVMMNDLKQLKLNLHCITCCFEYTFTIFSSLMYY